MKDGFGKEIEEVKGVYRKRPENDWTRKQQLDMTTKLYEKEIKRGDLLERLDKTRTTIKHVQKMLDSKVSLASDNSTTDICRKASDKVGYAMYYIAGAMFAVSRELDGYKGLGLDYFTEKNRPTETVNQIQIYLPEVISMALNSVQEIKRVKLQYKAVIGEQEGRYLDDSIESLISTVDLLKNVI